MVNVPDSDFVEDAALDVAFENHPRSRPRSVLESERERQAKGYPADIALEKWGCELEEMIARELEEPGD